MEQKIHPLYYRVVAEQYRDASAFYLGVDWILHECRTNFLFHSLTNQRRTRHLGLIMEL